MRTHDEIQAEVAALRRCLTLVAPQNCLGESNHACIQAQMEALLDDGIVIDYAPSRIRDAVRRTLDWKHGRIDKKPSKAWYPHEKYSSHDRYYHLSRAAAGTRTRRRTPATRHRRSP